MFIWNKLGCEAEGDAKIADADAHQRAEGHERLHGTRSQRRHGCSTRDGSTRMGSTCGGSTCSSARGVAGALLARACRLGAIADASEKTIAVLVDTMNAVLRPQLSASTPQIGPPTTMPANTIAASSASSASLSDQAHLTCVLHARRRRRAGDEFCGCAWRAPTRRHS